MSVINYLFIGFVFTFLLDFSANKFRFHPAFKNVPDWGWTTRITMILTWPLMVIVFIGSFIIAFFKK